MSVTLDGEQIRRLIVEVADEVASTDGGQRVVIVVGGSLLALHGMRDATRDVDSIRPIDDEVRRATRVVADRLQVLGGRRVEPFVVQLTDRQLCLPTIPAQRIG